VEPVIKLVFMLITLVSATPFEIQPTLDHLNEKATKKSENLYIMDKLQIRTLVTGVGMTLTALQMGLYLAKEEPDLVINVGVAGALNPILELGEVVHLISDRFGDLGVEEVDGSFLDVHELGLIKGNDDPFQKGILHNKAADEFEFLPKVHGITVNTVHGYQSSITAFKKQFNADVETMESAAFFLACLQTKNSFLAIRSISNYVEPRNRKSWKLGLAIDNINQVLIEILNNLRAKN
jgi:futalosine hydrolase